MTHLVLCFAYDSVGLVHLAERVRLGDKTLCGKDAMPKPLPRRLVTCEDCKRLRPSQQGLTS